MTMQPAELRTLRKAMGMTQGDLATALDMAVSSIGRMERGELPIERRTDLAVRWLHAQAQVAA
ncbi:helix-turn-helix transcriptional regulator [Sphingomonas sp. VNH70]|uniref:helix-turn-helix domain-containing protein n=1 Tax=Sphingomonas silueang TaxID=3156617 RepID=UPI0032B55433